MAGDWRNWWGLEGNFHRKDKNLNLLNTNMFAEHAIHMDVVEKRVSK